MQALWFGLFPVRSPLLGNISFPLLRCFSSPGSLSSNYVLRCFSFPIRTSRITACTRLPEAYRSVPSSAFGAKAFTVVASPRDAENLITLRFTYFRPTFPPTSRYSVFKVPHSDRRARPPRIYTAGSEHFPRFAQIPRAGDFEPATFALQRRCSPTELHPQIAWVVGGNL
jgi:hypothetical protein